MTDRLRGVVVLVSGGGDGGDGGDVEAEIHLYGVIERDFHSIDDDDVQLPKFMPLACPTLSKCPRPFERSAPRSVSLIS